jgi:hypothetical protein
MQCCESTDLNFPFYADIYYPIITQGGYGEIKKEWVFDRTIICNASSVGGAGEEEIKPAEFLQYENKLIARSRTDLRINSHEVNQALTNILITNIRNSAGELIYKETSGPRNNRGTIYEIATLEPFVGPFNNIEYFKMLWRRTENQSVGD